MAERMNTADAAEAIARAIKHYGMSNADINATHPNILTVTLRPPHSSRVFVINLKITEGMEL